MTDTIDPNELAYGLISPYLDLDEVTVATDALEPPDPLWGRVAGQRSTNDVRSLPPDSVAELGRFWSAHPDLRTACREKYGFDPVEEPSGYWPFGLAEPEHADVLAAIRENGGTFTLELVRMWEKQELADAEVEKADVAAAGIAVRAADTGRVLMIQRSLGDNPADKAAGTWEFPGGKLNPGEHPYVGAKREWQEETGLRLPKGHHAGQWRHGIYQGFVHEVRSEDAVKLNVDHEDRRVLNPDDPDGDEICVVAWHDPTDLRYMRALRPELRATKVWTKVEKGTARPATVHLRIGGVSRNPAGLRVYRMVTRDGQYVGRTNPTKVRARKGDVLRVEAADMLQDAQGDLRWMNADVAASIRDTPHSWRELCAMAGGDVEKDNAPGPAGDIPPPGDTGVDQDRPSEMTLDTMEPAAAAGTGPTAASVHVNVPLPNVSQAYVRGRKGKAVLRGEFLPISKEGQMKQLVYGVVLAPNELDSQDDFMLPHHVESTAHGYLKKAIRGKSSVAKLQHRAQGFFKDKPSICPVESFIAPVDFSYDGVDMIKKGSWVMCMHVEDPDLWQRFLDGEFAAFSVGGTGIRQSMSSNLDLTEHDLIGRQQPNYFDPDPRKLIPFG